MGKWIEVTSGDRIKTLVLESNVTHIQPNGDYGAVVNFVDGNQLILDDDYRTLRAKLLLPAS